MGRARGGAATRDLHRAVGRGVSGKGWIETFVPVRVTHASVKKRKRRECGDLATHEIAAAACLPVLPAAVPWEAEGGRGTGAGGAVGGGGGGGGAAAAAGAAGGAGAEQEEEWLREGHQTSEQQPPTTLHMVSTEPKAMQSTSLREGRSSIRTKSSQKRSSSPPSCSGISKPKKCDKHQGESGTFMSALLSKFLWPVTFHKGEERVCK